MTFSKLAAAAALATLVPMAAQAVSLNLETRSTPEISGIGTAQGIPFVGLFFDGPVLSSEPGDPIDLFASIFGDILGGSTALNVGGGSGVFLSGTQTDFGTVFDMTGDDRIEILFSGLGGSSAPSFGRGALAVITGDFGVDEASAFASGFGPANATLSIQPIAPVPVPGALPLLLGALALVSATAARRRD